MSNGWTDARMRAFLQTVAQKRAFRDKFYGIYTRKELRRRAQELLDSIEHDEKVTRAREAWQKEQAFMDEIKNLRKRLDECCKEKEVFDQEEKEPAIPFIGAEETRKRPRCGF